MVPPAVNDPWFAGRHFGIVIDAGSSGSRLQIYSWRDPKGINRSKELSLLHALPKVEKGTKDDESWVKKIEPGLSALASDPTAAGRYLRPLITHAMDQIPPSLHASTPIFLLATAGMRLLSPEEQAAILMQSCQFLRSFTHFKLDTPSKMLGPCGSSVRIITGEEEGLFGWIAVNYLMDGFTSKARKKGKGKEKEVDSPRTTYGFLDMGGASTQIAFEPNAEHVKDVKGKGLVNVRLRLLSGEEIRHKVFVTTWLGYGTNQARERYVERVVRDYEEAYRTETDSDGAGDAVPDPCLPKDLELMESLPDMNSHALLGTGSFEQCVQKSAPLLNTDTPCTHSPCLMNGVHVPPIDFSVSHFIGVSEYWYSSEHIFGLGGAYDFVQYERAAVEFCGRDWKGILRQHDESQMKHQLGGDGEVVEDGKVVDIDVWGPHVEVPRLQMQCFKAAWIVNILHAGLGMPRIVDVGGNVTTSGEKVVEQAEQKGLGKPPTFQSMDTVGDIAISWTLGKMVLEASKEVPPLTKGAKPLVDPVDDIDDYDNSPVKPIRPPFLESSLKLIEDHLTPLLPTSLTREPSYLALFLICFQVLFVLQVVLCLFQRRIGKGCMRIRRRSMKQIKGVNEDLEEGNFLNGNSPASPSSPKTSWIRRIFSIPRKNSLGTHPSRPAIVRSYSSPASPNASVFLDLVGATVVSSTRYNVPRDPSPVPGTVVDHGQQLLTSRSRNSSQINLASLGSRSPVPPSRTNSTLFSRK